MPENQRCNNLEDFKAELEVGAELNPEAEGEIESESEAEIQNKTDVDGQLHIPSEEKISEGAKTVNFLILYLF